MKTMAVLVYIENEDPDKLGMHLFEINMLGEEDEYGTKKILDEGKISLYVE